MAGTGQVRGDLVLSLPFPDAPASAATPRVRRTSPSSESFEKVLAPPPKRPCLNSLEAEVTHARDKLGEYIVQDLKFLRQHGFEALVQRRRTNDWGKLHRARRHPAHRLLHHYKHHGAPVVLADSPWSLEELDHAVARGPHKSAHEYWIFLREDMASMVEKGQWIVLPYSAVHHLLGLRAHPIGGFPQHDRRPRPIADLTFFGVNDATQPATAVEAMQFGHVLDRLIRAIVHANPELGPVYLSKTDLKDGFYRIYLSARDVPKLAVLFPAGPDEPELIALPLALPMGWKNSPPIFSTATETVADITNQDTLKHRNPAPHRLDDDADSPPGDVPLAYTDDPTLAVPIPSAPDPNLKRARRRPLALTEIYVDDYIQAAQGNRDARNRLRRILFHAIDDVFRPLHPDDGPHRAEPISVNKLRKGDASWSTCKKVLGWLIDTDAAIITLPPNRLQRLETILAEFPSTRRRASVESWHKLLGELRSMAVALPASHGLFSHLQAALQRAVARGSRRIRLTSAVHVILDDFRFLCATITGRPTRLQELVPVAPTIHGDHDAAGHGAGGIILPTATTVARSATLRSADATVLPAQVPEPVLWRMSFPKDIRDRLVSRRNPSGDITNSDLELAGAVLHHACAADCFDIRERTVLSRTDNLATLFWSRKGSVTTTNPAAALLRQLARHRRYHRYLALSDYIPGPLNLAADDASRLQHLSATELLTHFNSHYPQTRGWRLWTPPPKLRSCVISCLRNKSPEIELWHPAPPPPILTGASGPTSASPFPSILSYKTSPTLSTSYKCSSTESARGPLHLSSKTRPTRFELAPLRIPYGALAKRSLVWGPRIHASNPRANWISASTIKSAATKRKTLLPTV